MNILHIIKNLFRRNKKHFKSNKLEIFDSLEDLVNGKQSKNKNLNIKKIPLRKIKITSDALEKIYVIAEATTLECYALLLGKKDIVYDIFVPTQFATGISVNVNENAIFEAALYIKKTEYSVLGWAHSHANMSVFFSTTDDTNQERLLNETTNFIEDGRKFVYGMTVNRKRERIAFISTQYSDASIQMIEGKFEIIPVKTNVDKIKEKYTIIMNKKMKYYNYRNESLYNNSKSWNFYI